MQNDFRACLKNTLLTGTMQFNRSEQRTQSIGCELIESLFCYAIASLNVVSFSVA